MKYLVFAAAVLSPLLAFGVAPDASANLHDLFDRQWKWALSEYPMFATAVGVHDYDDRLGSVSDSDEERRMARMREFLDEVKAIPREGLSTKDRISAEMFQLDLEEGLESHRFREDQIPLSADWGFHTSLTRLPEEMPFQTIREYENYVARLNAIPKYVDQHIVLMREGLSRGMTLPKVVLKGIDETMTAHVVSDAEKSVWWKPFAHFPAAFSEADRKKLSEAGRTAILNSAVPAFRKLADFMVRDYIPHARTTIATSDLPEGRAYYEFLLKRYTTLPLTAEQIHETGLSEVARIQKEMDEVIRQVGFKGDFKAFLQFLRTDPRFYAKTPEELLERASWICKRMDGKLPSLFKTLPRLPYGVAPVPAEMAPKFTGGRYVEAPVGSTQPGYFWVNTYQLDQRPFYTL